MYFVSLFIYYYYYFIILWVIFDLFNNTDIRKYENYHRKDTFQHIMGWIRTPFEHENVLISSNHRHTANLPRDWHTDIGKLFDGTRFNVRKNNKQ